MQAVAYKNGRPQKIGASGGVYSMSKLPFPKIMAPPSPHEDRGLRFSNNQSRAPKALAEHNSIVFGKPDIKVSAGQDKYFCTIESTSRHRLGANELYNLLVDPNRDAGSKKNPFRDIDRVVSREILSQDGSKQVVRVQQIGKVTVPVVRLPIRFKTVLDVTEIPDEFKSEFSLVESEAMSQFDGSWTAYEMSEKDSVLILRQDLKPRWVPEVLLKAPGTSNLLRRACAKAIKRIIEDIDKHANSTEL